MMKFKLSKEKAPETFHRQVRSKSLPGITIDKKIVSLIDFLVTHGVTTTFSCQGDPGNDPHNQASYLDAGYISFASSDDLLTTIGLLRDIAFSAGDPGLAARVLGSAYVKGIDDDRVFTGDPRLLSEWRFEFTHRTFSDVSRPDLFGATLRANFEDLLQLNDLIASI